MIRSEPLFARKKNRPVAVATKRLAVEMWRIQGFVLLSPLLGPACSSPSRTRLTASRYSGGIEFRKNSEKQPENQQMFSRETQTQVVKPPAVVGTNSGKLTDCYKLSLGLRNRQEFTCNFWNPSIG